MYMRIARRASLAWIIVLLHRRLRGNKRRRWPPIGKSLSVSFCVCVVGASDRARRSCVGVRESNVSQRWCPGLFLLRALRFPFSFPSPHFLSNLNWAYQEYFTEKLSRMGIDSLWICEDGERRRSHCESQISLLNIWKRNSILMRCTQWRCGSWIRFIKMIEFPRGDSFSSDKRFISFQTRSQKIVTPRNAPERFVLTQYHCDSCFQTLL